MALLANLWLVALALCVLGASSVTEWIVQESVILGHPALLALAETLAERSARAPGPDPVEVVADLTSRARPRAVWLRLPSDALPEPTPAVIPPDPQALAPAADGPATKRSPLVADGGQRILLVGASSIQLHLGAEIERALRASYRGVVVERVGKIASGLARPDYFDWPRKTAELIAEFQPQVVIAQFGGNDAQSIVAGGRILSFGTGEWDEAFGRRVSEWIEIVRAADARIIVLGMPMMRDPGFSKRMAHVNGIIQRRVEQGGGTFVSTWDLSSAGGHYTNSIELDGSRHLLRSSDGVHNTREGAIYIAQKLVEHFDRELPLVPLDQTRSVVVRRELAAGALRRTARYLAYVPQSAVWSEATKMPALFLLHGKDGDFSTWAAHAHRALQELSTRHRLIIVTPEGGSAGWYLDSTIVDEARYESHIIEEVVTNVDETLPSSGVHAIAGCGAGGHGAITLALKHPGLFTTVSAMGGPLDLTAAAGDPSLIEQLGPYAAAHDLWERNSARHLVRRHAPVALELQFFVSVVSSDPWASTARAFVDDLAALGAPPAFDPWDGEDGWSAWTKQLPRHLAWHAATLERATAPRLDPVGAASHQVNERAAPAE